MFFDKQTRHEFVDYWKCKADRVQITPYVQYPRVRSWRLPRKKMKDLNFCNRLEEDMVVLTSGEASKCCIDFECATSFGNLHNKTIRDIWKGPARRLFIEKMRIEKRKGLYPCNICVI